MTPPDDPTTLHTAVVRHYDGLFHSDIHEEMFGNSGFSNYGYWTSSTRSATQASEQLVDKLLERVPKRGSVLDVACGSGGTTARLATIFDTVTALNISAYQIARTRARVPRCRALQVDATRLPFKDASFDAVVCVEAAFHFSSKARFFAEARRVLKPAGWLTLSDLIFTAPRESYAVRLAPQLPSTTFPHANQWNVLTYGDFLEVLGFNASISSAYQETWQRFLAFFKSYLNQKIAEDPTRNEVYRQWLDLYAKVDAVLCDYVLVSAQRT